METWSGLKLQSLLCLAWFAATFPIVVAALPIPTGRLIHRLWVSFSSRGKTARTSSSSSSSSKTLKSENDGQFTYHISGQTEICRSSYCKVDFWVPLINQSSLNCRISQFHRNSSCTFIYVVGVAVTTVLLVAIWFYAYMEMTPLSTEPPSYSSVANHIVNGSNLFSLSNFLSRPKEHKYLVWRSVFLLLLMEIQVLRRMYETAHVFQYIPSARMHIVGYLTGDLDHCVNTDSDEYVIPRGDWFDRVSCPHYLPEVVIYFGMLIASDGSDILVWFLFLWVITNLSFEAVHTHKWYLQKFEDYPRYRYAIIPFVC